MKAYRSLIKPQISHPDQHYKPVCRDLEQDGKWYAEEEKEAIKEKYKHLENTFEQVVFDVKYEPIDAIPVEYLMKYAQLPTEFAIAAWRKQDKDAQEKQIKRLDKPMPFDDALNLVNEVFSLGQQEQEAQDG